MRILFIGGTSFVGRYMAAEAVARGHEVTLFHRGKTGPDLFPEAEHVLGDRSADLDLLSGRTWDAAIDACAYRPREVREAAVALGASIGTYCYISTVDVYRRTGAAAISEDAPLQDEEQLADPAAEEITWETYGPLKALCEREAERGFPGRVLAIRPTYVIGPHDPTDRFTYWVRRASVGGSVLAPGPSDAPEQLIDGRDLGAFAIDLVERKERGAYQGVGPAEPITFGAMVSSCVEAVGDGAELLWVDPTFLREGGVEIERELPLWNPPEEYEVVRCDPAKSLAAGLRLRPLADSIRDTLAWDLERGLPLLRDAMTAERETELLDAWRASA